MNKGIISIIIPMYNSEKFLEKSLESVVNQTYPNIEIILINDGSIDQTETICLKYKNIYNNIKYFFIKHSGVSVARNLGVYNASGEWLTFIDSDDIITNDYCSKLYENVNDNIDLVIGRTLSFCDDIKVFNYDGFRGKNLFL